jgi:hypothetical protein
MVPAVNTVGALLPFFAFIKIRLALRPDFGQSGCIIISPK